MFWYIFSIYRKWNSKYNINKISKKSINLKPIRIGKYFAFKFVFINKELIVLRK